MTDATLHSSELFGPSKQANEPQGEITPLEAVRAEVKFALETQPGEEGPAIDGDGHTILKLSFFARKVPPAWLDEIADKLFTGAWVHLGRDGQSWVDEDGKRVQVVKGVYALSFHYWVADKVVMKVDPKFHSYAGSYIGRGKQAQAIEKALIEWVKAGQA